MEFGCGGEQPAIIASRLMSFLYGAGLALDEFALWLNREDVYWDREGRASIDAFILFGALLLIAIWEKGFFKALAHELIRSRSSPSKMTWES